MGEASNIVIVVVEASNIVMVVVQAMWWLNNLQWIPTSPHIPGQHDVLVHQRYGKKVFLGHPGPPSQQQ